MAGPAWYAFDIVVHPRRAEVVGAGLLHDRWGQWPVLEPPCGLAGHTFRRGFEEAVARLAALERMFVELDGALVWRGDLAGRTWQIDGTAWDRDGRLARVEVRGHCPAPRFDQLLTACGWPADQVLVELVRAGRFLDEDTFRRHAVARAAGESAATLPTE